MQSDEQAIRNVVAAWLEATAAGDVSKLQSLMAEDAVFLTPGQQPLRGRDAFIAAFQAGIEQIRIDAQSEIQEIQIVGDVAWLSNHLTVTVTPRQGGSPTKRSGFTLTIFQKQPDGQWVLVRDANLLTTEASGPT